MTQNTAHHADAVITILDSLDALVYVSDMQTYQLLYVNKYGTDLWGNPANKKCFEYLQSNQISPCSFCTNNKLVDVNGKPTGPYVWEFQNTVNGHWYQCRDQAIYWPDGRLVRIEIATDITDRKLIEQQLANAKAIAERQAATDELTQLSNRRAFFQKCASLFTHNAPCSSLALIMFDLDSFKKINDTYGHAAGDLVLINVAEVLRKCLTPQCFPARLGGEEFAILLVDTTLQQAADIAEILRKTMAEQHITMGEQVISYTASFGVTADIKHNTNLTLDQLLNTADQAMMQAKRLGRNKIITA